MKVENLNKCLINLPERFDRLHQSVREIEDYFNGDNLKLMDGVKKPRPFTGIAEAHMNCIKKAKYEKWDCVLIMEDDLVFQGKEKTLPYFNLCLENLPDDWDVLLGGVYDGSLYKENDYWNRVGKFCGLHFYIVNHKVYDTLLKYDYSYEYDVWMNYHLNLNCFVTAKFIAIQRNGFSDNKGREVNYESYLKNRELL